ncbi:MAG: hypothetical protein ACRC5M_07060 [Anaeroplasmataceae bacterium]
MIDKDLNYIAVLCEGGAEDTIINILLENNLLTFSMEDMLENRTIRERSADRFVNNYLKKTLNKKVIVLRVLDSKKENFNFDKHEAYKHKIQGVINIITAPEIEILIIISEDRYNDYKNKYNSKRPSRYCTEVLKFKNCKSVDFVKKYFSNTSKLLNALKLYNQYCINSSNEYGIFHLLKEEYKK